MNDIEEISLEQYARILQKRWRRIFGYGLTAMIVAGIVSFLLPKIYRADTTLIFPTAAPTGLAALGGAGAGAEVSIPFLEGLLSVPIVGTGSNTCITLLNSRIAKERVVKELGLIKEFHAERISEAVRKLEKMTRIEITKEAALNISVESKSPELAANIANTYVATLKELSARFTGGQARKNREFIEGRLYKAESELKEAASALQSFQEKYQIVALPEEIKGLLDVQSYLEQQHATTKVSLDEVTTRLDSVGKHMRTQAAQAGILPTASPFIKGWRDRIVELEADLAVATHTYGPQHRTVLQKNIELAEAKRQLKREVERELKALKQGIAPEVIHLETDRIATDAKLSGLTTILDKFGTRLQGLPPRQVELARLQRRVSTQTELATILTQEYERARILEDRESLFFQVVDTAVPPDKKVKPRRLLNMVVAGLLGLFVGVLVVFWQERKELIATAPSERS